MLIRIAAATDDPLDDLILEARTQSLPEYRGCVWPKVFGVLPNPGGDELPEIWIQSWERGYRELSLADLRERFTQLRAFELTEQRARDLARSPGLTD